MITEYQGICRHCGQAIFVESIIENLSEELITELAEEKCVCQGARLARGIKDTEARIKKILTGESIERGFDYNFLDETIKGIRAICEMILKGEIDKVTLTEASGDVLRLVQDGNAVKIKRSTKLQVEM